MTETPPIISGLHDTYFVKWKLTKGSPAGGTRNEEGWPTKNNSLDGMPTEEVSYFETEYQWDGVELKYDSSNEEGKKPLIGYTVTPEIWGFDYNDNTEPADPNGDQADDEGIGTPAQVQYRILSLSIKSNDPNDGDTWRFPDDFPEIRVDPNHPKQYGGVILFADDDKCGIDDGPANDGMVNWYTTKGGLRKTMSGYNYIDVFDQSVFEFIPRNSFTNVSMGRAERFRFTPFYPELKDEKGKNAPIYPMNAVTSFLPDSRDSVTVTYEVEVKARVMVGNDFITVNLENGKIKVRQTCTQDTSDYGEQLTALMNYCAFTNDRNDKQDLAPYYVEDYPYTLVNGYDGLDLNVTPTTRGDDQDKAPLQRGDVWYNPDTEERLYWNVDDVPDRLVLIEEGSRYRTRENVPCIWEPDTTCNPTKDRNVPFGVLVDIEAEKGKVKSIKLTEDSLPQYFEDGDELVIQGGDGQARVKVEINKPPRWSNKYQDHHTNYAPSS